ncbi:lipid-binding SYLF domain-containing protein [Cellulophaga baltica]|uniref:lipid-binding SYLF domain-containing protein n=1 Tax=Cellulophaga TaxID=104264 RepID=UPI001C07B566|nr:MULTISPECIES: lipid-binding SYLF domain-containing protein [Cellulophaga]MBU2995292.1 lipid-binding SYLF domain-containing protein [Cellulophaga baltica]MDO6766687.1 lipid-binding SYLF domain-containing protein [Cellulophaga sp. 1_MG-2023]
MKKMKYFTALVIVLLAFNVNAQTSKQKRIIEDATEAKETLLKTDEGLKHFFDNAAGYVIFPNVGKGGFIIGGASGNGVVYEGGEKVGMAGLKKLNIGLQAGGQSIIEVIFFETPSDVREFKKENFNFGAEASAVAIKSGIAFNAKYKDGVAVFALPKAGLMADASVGGQKFSYDSF